MLALHVFMDTLAIDDVVAFQFICHNSEIGQQEVITVRLLKNTKLATERRAQHYLRVATLEGQFEMFTPARSKNTHL